MNTITEETSLNWLAHVILDHLDNDKSRAIKSVENCTATPWDDTSVVQYRYSGDVVYDALPNEQKEEFLEWVKYSSKSFIETRVKYGLTRDKIFFKVPRQSLINTIAAIDSNKQRA